MLEHKFWFIFKRHLKSILKLKLDGTENVTEILAETVIAIEAEEVNGKQPFQLGLSLQLQDLVSITIIVLNSVSEHLD